MTKIYKSSLCILLLCTLFGLGACTSPDAEDSTVLDEALDELDSDSIAEEGEDDGTLSSEDVDDEDSDATLDEMEDDIVADAEKDFGDEDEDPEIADSLEDEDLDDEDLDDEDLDDEDLADEDDEDLDEDDEDFADFDDEDDEDIDDFDEDDEDFADFDDEDDEDEDEDAALAKELDGKQDYPETAEAKPQFPGEGQPVPVIGEAGTAPPVESETVIDGQAVGGYSEPPLPQDDLGTPDPLVASDDAAGDNITWVPVKKIKVDPFFRNGRLLNTVYIARPGDSLETVSQKIYGTDRSSDLLADNPYLDRGVDPGDKVYYNSTNRPDDKSNIKVFYDDVGLQGQTYITKGDDDMRRLGSKLLGFQEGWKEIWAINPNVISKSALTPGIELRYWKGSEGQQALAQGSLGQEPPNFQDSPLPTQEAFPEPEVPQIEDLPPEPEFADVSPEPLPTQDPSVAGLTDPGDLGSPVGEVASEPAAREDTIRKNEELSLGTIGAIALVILAGAGLISIQIKNRKTHTMMPPTMDYTQV